MRKKFKQLDLKLLVRLLLFGFLGVRTGAANRPGRNFEKNQIVLQFLSEIVF